MTAEYRKRWAEDWIHEAVKEEPVVILTGARQVGKSTLLKHSFKDWAYITLDDFDYLEQAEKDPMAIFAGKENIIIDEAQRAPKLLQGVKQAVDESNRKRRFILSGSANLLLMQKVTESLAGRAVISNLHPFTLGEYLNCGIKKNINNLLSGKTPQKTGRKNDNIRDFVLTGWMPTVMLERSNESVWRWFEGYVASYLERDLRQLSQIDSLSDFRRLMMAIAMRSGQLLNQTEMGRDISLKQPTVHRYVNILEASTLLERLPAYSVNRTKRLIKSPKPYYVDSGLANFLSGSINDVSDKQFGMLFESSVYHHLKVWCELQIPKANLLYWRTVSGLEVDFLIERGRDLLAIEVKATDKPKFNHADSLRKFMDEYPEARSGLVVHLGTEHKQLGNDIYALPFVDLV